MFDQIKTQDWKFNSMTTSDRVSFASELSVTNKFLPVYDSDEDTHYIWTGSSWKLSDWVSDSAAYVLPIASASVLGGVKIGSGLSIDGAGVLSTNSASFIQNQNSVAQTANYWINGISKASVYQSIGSVAAASGYATANAYTNQLVATANNDILLAADFQPTYSLGAFTGVKGYALRAANIVIGSGTDFPNQANVTGSLNIVNSTGLGISIKSTGATTSSQLQFVSSANAAIGFSVDHTNKLMYWTESGNGYQLKILPSVGATKGFQVYYGYGTAGLYSKYTNWPTNGDAATRWGFDQSTPLATVDVNGNLRVAGTFYGTAGSPNLTTEFKAVDISPTINQYTGSTAAMYGLYYNPTLTSVLGTHYGLYINSGLNYFSGSVLIGTTANNGFKLDVNGTLAIRGASTFLGNMTVQQTGDNALLVNSTGTTGAATLVLKTGDTATSSKYAYMSFQANSSTPQRWDVGMYGSTSMTFRNVTTGFTPFYIDPDGTMLLKGNSTNQFYFSPTYNGGPYLALTGTAPMFVISRSTNTGVNSLLEITDSTSGGYFKLRGAASATFLPALYVRGSSTYPTFWFVSENAVENNSYGSIVFDGRLTTGALTTQDIAVFQTYGNQKIRFTSTGNIITLVGDNEISTIGNGYIVKSPNGTRYRITVSDAGAVIATAI